MFIVFCVAEMTDNLSRQVEEVEALCSIYGNEWNYEGEASYSIQIKEGQQTVTLHIKLPKDYPSHSPPVYQVSAPELKSQTKQEIAVGLDEIYLENIGEAVIFQWIEKIRELLQGQPALPEEIYYEEIEAGSSVQEHVNAPGDITLYNYELPEICHGDVITDRKSVFQGHAASVVSTEQVKQVLQKLNENKKIAHATHNIHAYRIFKDDTKSYIHDCEDDGESQAGSRMLHLMQILDVKNVLVVVSRWYGGVHLGPDRFRHINNAARQVLDKAGFLMRAEQQQQHIKKKK